VIVAHGLDRPGGIFVDDDNKTILVTDFYNHRVMQWKIGRKNGMVVAGGHDRGSQPHQLNYPTDVLIDKETDSLIISNWGMEQVVRWSRSNDTFEGEILINKIRCWGLAMDDQRYLYVSDVGENQVKRYQLGGDMKHGVTVAGGNGRGSDLNQLNDPKRIFVDQHQTVYVSDCENHRVVKWIKGATEGIVVAGGQGPGNSLTQLNLPAGLLVDASGAVYMADGLNHRVMRWSQGAEQGTVIVDGSYERTGSYELRMLSGMCFDRRGNLYVVDSSNNLVRRFTII
jgi:sugar lactone lactonase YvrE